MVESDGIKVGRRGRLKLHQNVVPIKTGEMKRQQHRHGRARETSPARGLGGETEDLQAKQP